jgi:hypothetical protein
MESRYAQAVAERRRQKRQAPQDHAPGHFPHRRHAAFLLSVPYRDNRSTRRAAVLLLGRLVALALCLSVLALLCALVCGQAAGAVLQHMAMA